MTRRVLPPTNLLINQPFALRQRNGIPVFTTIETEIIPHSKELLDKYRYVYEHGYKLPDMKKRIKTDYPINLNELRRIIITPNGKGYVSTFFLEFCKVHQIPIYFIDAKGRIEASFMPFHYLKPSLALKQYEAKVNGKTLDICKYIIMLKLESMGMKHLIPNLRKANDIRTVQSVEAIATTKYRSDWSFPDEWNWRGRRNKNFRTRKNKYATDPINSMLRIGD